MALKVTAEYSVSGTPEYVLSECEKTVEVLRKELGKPVKENDSKVVQLIQAAKSWVKVQADGNATPGELDYVEQRLIQVVKELDPNDQSG